ncbi:MAG: hypothetical protein JO256_07155 [Alphaproteobacteria bacterium]|nr:hypothetical protein [Alphaproteobacteria bacterium]
MGRRFYMILLPVLTGLALAALALAFYAPALRETFVFKPARAAAERTVRRIAEAEAVRLRKEGSLLPLSASQTVAGSHVLGLDWETVAASGFQFDAHIQPNQHLQIRALPKPEAVSALEVAPQIYVADISPKGQFLSGVWSP